MRLDDAQVLKKLGRPLNTPISHHAFSEAYSRHWFALMDATLSSRTPCSDFLDETQSPSKWWSARRKFIALEQEADRCVGFWIALGGNTPLDAAPVFNSEQDAREYALLDFFISKRACPFLEFWQNVIEEAEAGNVPTFRLSDIPPWLDDELCGLGS